MSNSHSIEADIVLDPEYYNIEMEFTAHETNANMDRGTIYLASKLLSSR